METNENELSNDKEAKKKPMLGYDAMTVWQRSGCCLYAGLEKGVGQWPVIAIAYSISQ